MGENCVIDKVDAIGCTLQCVYYVLCNVGFHIHGVIGKEY